MLEDLSLLINNANEEGRRIKQRRKIEALTKTCAIFVYLSHSYNLF